MGLKKSKKKYQNNFLLSKLLVYLLCQYRQTKLANMTTQELNKEVNAAILRGCKLPVAQIEAILLKSEANKAKNMKRKMKGFARRAEWEANPSDGNLVLDGVVYDNLSEYNRACGRKLMSIR